MIGNLNYRKWLKWCILISHLLFNNLFGLPVLTISTNCTNDVFYAWLVDLQTICVKYGLETWFFPNDEIRKWLIWNGWPENASWIVKKKWRKCCKFVSPFLSNYSYGLPVLTKGNKCPSQVFHVWLVDLQIICAK
jgi:hypothetical protein